MLAIFYNRETDYISHLLQHLYSKSVAGILILLVNMRRDTRNLMLNYKERRLELLNKILDKVLTTSGDQECLEEHLNCVNIIGDCIQNWENIYDGKQMVKEILFTPENFCKIAEALANESKSSLGHLPNLFHLLFEFSKKNEEEYDECSPRV